MIDKKSNALHTGYQPCQLSAELISCNSQMHWGKIKKKKLPCILVYPKIQITHQASRHSRIKTTNTSPLGLERAFCPLSLCFVFALLSTWPMARVRTLSSSPQTVCSFGNATDAEQTQRLGRASLLIIQSCESRQVVWCFLL